MTETVPAKWALAANAWMQGMRDIVIYHHLRWSRVVCKKKKFVSNHSMIMIDQKWFEPTGLLFYLDETAWLHFLTYWKSLSVTPQCLHPPFVQKMAICFIACYKLNKFDD